MFVFCSMLSANWAIIIYCGWALNKALKSKGISNRTKTMQKELFRALIFQLIVPICCVFGPQPVLRFFTCGRQKIYQWGTTSSGRTSGKTAPQGVITKSSTQPDPETTSRNVII
ncbi:unnamed protein product, partial [Mesorhabditis spiculigera]